MNFEMDLKEILDLGRSSSDLWLTVWCGAIIFVWLEIIVHALITLLYFQFIDILIESI